MRKNFGIKLTVLALEALMLVGSDVFAFKGMMGKGGQGQGRGYDGCPLATQNLTDEQLTQLRDERNAFFTATEELRKNLADKQQELFAELQAENTNTDKVAAVQKEILDLKGQFSQKWVDHYLKIKAISPDLVKNFGGPGMMGGRGMGCLGGGFGCGAGGGMGFGPCGGGQGTGNQTRTNCPMAW